MNGQRLPLDRLRGASYIGAVAALVSLAACTGRLPPLVPAAVTLVPVSADSAVIWAARTLPPGPTAVRYRWHYRSDRVNWPGSAAARIAPPDSLRVDFRGALGAGSGAGVVIGDSVRWADPPESFHRLAPAVPMLWAALGIVRPPAAAAVAVAARDSTLPDGRRARWWRYAGAADTMDFVTRTGPDGIELDAEWRRDGRRLARCATRLAAWGRPVSSRVEFPEAGARLDITVVGVDSGVVIPASLWSARR